MSNIYKGEMQDYEGNTVYPHTEADVVFCTDGTTAQSKLNKYENALGSVTGKSDSLDVSSSNIVATAKAVNTLNKNMGGLKFGVDSDGNYGYIKAGADTVTPFNSIKTQTITQSISMPTTTTRSYTFIFDELEEVKGVLQITKKSTDTYGTYQYLIPVDGASQNADGSFWSINGNTVTITMRNQVNTSSTADWTITAVGF